MPAKARANIWPWHGLLRIFKGRTKYKHVSAEPSLQSRLSLADSAVECARDLLLPLAEYHLS